MTLTSMPLRFHVCPPNLGDCCLYRDGHEYGDAMCQLREAGATVVGMAASNVPQAGVKDTPQHF